MNYLSKSSGHEGIAGGQFSDLSFEKQKKSDQELLHEVAFQDHDFLRDITSRSFSLAILNIKI